MSLNKKRRLHPGTKLPLRLRGTTHLERRLPRLTYSTYLPRYRWATVAPTTHLGLQPPAQE
jgi:hypothetical protein